MVYEPRSKYSQNLNTTVCDFCGKFLQNLGSVADMFNVCTCPALSSSSQENFDEDNPFNSGYYGIAYDTLYGTPSHYGYNESYGPQEGTSNYSVSEYAPGYDIMTMDDIVSFPPYDTNLDNSGMYTMTVNDSSNTQGCNRRDRRHSRLRGGPRAGPPGSTPGPGGGEAHGMRNCVRFDSATTFSTMLSCPACKHDLSSKYAVDPSVPLPSDCPECKSTLDSGPFPGSREDFVINCWYDKKQNNIICSYVPKKNDYSDSDSDTKSFDSFKSTEDAAGSRPCPCSGPPSRIIPYPNPEKVDVEKLPSSNFSIAVTPSQTSKPAEKSKPCGLFIVPPHHNTPCPDKKIDNSQNKKTERPKENRKEQKNVQKKDKNKIKNDDKADECSLNLSCFLIDEHLNKSRANESTKNSQTQTEGTTKLEEHKSKCIAENKANEKKERDSALCNALNKANQKKERDSALCDALNKANQKIEQENTKSDAENKANEKKERKNAMRIAENKANERKERENAKDDTRKKKCMKRHESRSKKTCSKKGKDNDFNRMMQKMCGLDKMNNKCDPKENNEMNHKEKKGKITCSERVCASIACLVKRNDKLCERQNELNDKKVKSKKTENICDKAANEEEEKRQGKMCDHKNEKKGEKKKEQDICCVKKNRPIVDKSVDDNAPRDVPHVPLKPKVSFKDCEKECEPCRRSHEPTPIVSTADASKRKAETCKESKRCKSKTSKRSSFAQTSRSKLQCAKKHCQKIPLISKFGASRSSTDIKRNESCSCSFACQTAKLDCGRRVCCGGGVSRTPRRIDRSLRTPNKTDRSSKVQSNIDGSTKARHGKLDPGNMSGCLQSSAPENVALKSPGLAARNALHHASNLTHDNTPFKVPANTPSDAQQNAHHASGRTHYDTPNKVSTKAPSHAPRDVISSTPAAVINQEAWPESFSMSFDPEKSYLMPVRQCWSKKNSREVVEDAIKKLEDIQRQSLSGIETPPRVLTDDKTDFYEVDSAHMNTSESNSPRENAQDLTRNVTTEKNQAESKNSRAPSQERKANCSDPCGNTSNDRDKTSKPDSPTTTDEKINEMPKESCLAENPCNHGHPQSASPNETEDKKC